MWMATIIETECGEVKGGHWLGLCLWSLTCHPSAVLLALKKWSGLLTEVMLKVSPLVCAFYFHVCTGQGRKPKLQESVSTHKHGGWEIQLGKVPTGMVGGNSQHSQAVGTQRFWGKGGRDFGCWGRERVQILVGPLKKEMYKRIGKVQWQISSLLSFPNRLLSHPELTLIFPIVTYVHLTFETSGTHDSLFVC